MNDYYVNKNQQSNGDHEVHTSDCRYLPAEQNRIYLGSFDDRDKAVEAAKRYYSKVNGCIHCSEECNTS